jgi:hypothetical protein
LIYFYDVESFPNLFTVTFLEDETEKFFQFVIGAGADDREKLVEFLDREILLVGFNSMSYDNAIIRYIVNAKSSKGLPEKIYNLSQRLINDACGRDDDIRELRYPRNAYYSWKSIDLFKVLNFDRMGVSLKQVAINLGHEIIQDLPLPYDHVVAEESEVSLILEYNKNDVRITKKLYYKVLSQIKLREEIGKLYNVDVSNASDSKTGNIILEHYYQEQLNVDINALRELRTKRDFVDLKECIPDVISFKTEELINLYEKIKNTRVYSFDDFKFEELLFYRGTGYSIGSGGIHSTEKSVRFDSSPEKKIISCDIGSMYPSCIIINKIHPEHLGLEFVDVLSTLTAERLSAKKVNKTKAEALKITVNGMFGKLNSDTFWLEDAKAMLSVTIAGQLYILMLIEELELSGIHCISANTDGIECEVPTAKEELYYTICNAWEQRTGFKLEYVEYKSYIKRDVNNYIAIGSKEVWFTHTWRTASRETGKVKTKGVFIPEVDIKKGYKHPIVPKAVYEYFVNNIPVEETIGNCKNILDFCISQKSAKEFTMEYKTPRGIEVLQKTNRFYISYSGGQLQKHHQDGRIIGLYAGKTVQILNIYDPSLPFENYNVNLSFYIKEAKDLIEEVVPTAVQETLFEMNQDFGKRTNFQGKEIVKKKGTTTSKKITEDEIRQADKKKLTYDVDPSLALVIDLNLKYAPTLTFYSLSKGTKTTFKISKKDFEKVKLSYGDVVRLDGFEKKPRYKKEGAAFVPVPGEFVWWVNRYSIVNDFSDFKRKVK